MAKRKDGPVEMEALECTSCGVWYCVPGLRHGDYVRGATCPVCRPANPFRSRFNRLVYPRHDSDPHIRECA